MRFVDHSALLERFRGRSIAIVGSGPGSLDNEPGFVDAHDVVLRVNNYKTGPAQGFRTDVHYSFYGSSVRKTADELKSDGVTLCVCKCPDAQPIESDWHRRRGKLNGIDFRYIYRDRADWWFCDTFVPTAEHFMTSFELLGGHIPTTGFAAILDVLEYEPKSLFLTGFDFFESKIHNVNEPWRVGDPSDPIGHRPELELAWLRGNAKKYPISFDKRLAALTAQTKPTEESAFLIGAS